VTTNLRIALTILSLGFAVEGASEAYSVVSSGSFRPGTTLVFLVPVLATVAGLVFVWIGRHEWNATHRDRVRQAHVVFALSLLGAVVAAGVLAGLYLDPSLGTPGWAQVAFGAAAASLVFGTFVTYAVLIFHLVGRPSKAVLLASIGWAFLVSVFVGETLGGDLGVILGLVRHRTLATPGFLAPVDTLASYLFVSYFLLLAAYVEAHRAVAQGRPAVGAPAGRAPGSEGR
jgi:hypothetical protein